MEPIILGELLTLTWEPPINVESKILVQEALTLARQGIYLKAYLLLSLAYQQAVSEDERLAAKLEAALQKFNHYQQIQQELQEVSKRLFEAEQEQKANLDELAALIPDTSFINMPPKEFSNRRVGIALPGLYITCFNQFEVWRHEQPVTLCANRNGQAVLRYLVAQPDHRASADSLMEIFWPEEEPEVARHRLSVAISALRRSLNREYSCNNGGGYILFKDDIYRLNPAVEIQTDVARFLEFYQGAQHTDKLGNFLAACQLYKGAFLYEDFYADWSQLERERLSQRYSEMCGWLANYYLETKQAEQVVEWATRLIRENRCDEIAYSQLMQAYAVLGHRTEILRQYQRCKTALSEELGVAPAPETDQLFYRLLGGTPQPGITRPFKAAQK